MPLTKEQISWIEQITGPVAEEAEREDALAAEQQGYIDQMRAALDRLRDAIREGEDYVLQIKTQRRFLPDKVTEVKAIQDTEHTFDEAETWEDFMRAGLLPPEQQRKIMEAHANAVKVKGILEDAKRKDGNHLFTTEEIMEEFWNPVMRERLLPENAIPGKYSAFQKSFEASARLFIEDTAKEEEEDEMSENLGSAAELADAVGYLAQAGLAVMGDSTTVASNIQRVVVSGIKAVKGAYDKDADGIVNGVTKVIATAFSLAGNAELGRKIAGGVKAVLNAGAIARELMKKNGKEKIGKILDYLGTVIKGVLAASDTPTTQDAGAITGNAIAIALAAQKPVVEKFLLAKKGKRDRCAIANAFTRAATKVFTDALDLKTKIAEDQTIPAAENTKDEKEKALQQAEEDGQADTSEQETAVIEAEAEVTAAEEEINTAEEEDEERESILDELVPEEEASEDEAAAKEGEEAINKARDAIKKSLGAPRDPQAEKGMDEKLSEMASKAMNDQLHEKSAEFTALLEETEEEEGDSEATPQQLRSIDGLIEQMKADQKVLDSFGAICDVTGNAVDHFVPGARALGEMKDFVYTVIAAAERWAQADQWLRHQADAQTALSPYADAIQNRLINANRQKYQQTFKAVLRLAQTVGAVMQFTPLAAAGYVAEETAAVADKTMDIVLKFYDKGEMAAAWKEFQKAFKNPNNRRAAKRALQKDPTLAKYALAYGALQGDPIAREAMNRCGLTDETLAGKETNVTNVVKYLELKFADDPKLRKAMREAPEWAPEGSKIELTMESWVVIKQAAIAAKDGLDPKQPTAAIDGAMVSWTKVHAEVEEKKEKEELTEADWKALGDAVASLKTALGRFKPKTAKGEPMSSMEDYVRGLLELVEKERKQVDKYQAEKLEKEMEAAEAKHEQKQRVYR